MRGDVREASSISKYHLCPTCGSAQHFTRYGQYPAVLTTGAWGKYLNPVYLCQGCQRAYVLAVYEADDEIPEMRPYPKNTAPDRHLTNSEKLEKYRGDA